MFTGLIQHCGTITARDEGPDATRLLVDHEGWDHQPEPGASIAINGCCLTVVEAGERLAFDVIPVTLERTTLGTLEIGSRVNLEHAATPTTLLGGHLVQGHVDGVGRVLANGATPDSGWILQIDPPPTVADYLIEKGSITIEGVSLTVKEAADGVLEVALIPETLERTTLGALKVDDRVNLESDCLARMVETLLSRRGVLPGGSEHPDS